MHMGAGYRQGLAMLVDCYPLREDGRKLPAASIKTRGPVRGHLVIERRENRSIYPGEQEREPWLVTASLVPRLGDARAPFWMSSVREVRRTEAGLLLYGQEQYGNLSSHLYQPQAWWCAFVEHAGGGA